MKKLFLAITVLSLSTASFAGHEFGNGGGVVVCRRPILKTIKSVELLDFYEARTIRGIQTDLGDSKKPWKEQIQFVLDRLRPRSELRYQIYGRWLESFEKESLFVKDANFTTIEDTAHVAIPKGCAFEQAAVQKRPEFPNDPRYYMNQDLWDHMSESQKAGLVLHELTYREAIGYGHDLSTSTRYFVGKIASQEVEKMSDEDFFELIKEVKFEQTDLPVPSGNGVMSIRLKRFWNPSKYEADPGFLDLKGRVVVQVGQCKGVGCEELNTETFGNNLQCKKDDSGYLTCVSGLEGVPTAFLSQDLLSFEIDGVSFFDPNYVSEAVYQPQGFTDCTNETPYIRHELRFRGKDYKFSSMDNYIVMSAMKSVPSEKCEVMRLLKMGNLDLTPNEDQSTQFVKFTRLSVSSEAAFDLTLVEANLEGGISFYPTGDSEAYGSGCVFGAHFEKGKLTELGNSYYLEDTLTDFKRKVDCKLGFRSKTLLLKNEVNPKDPATGGEDITKLFFKFNEKGELIQADFDGFSGYWSTEDSHFYPEFTMTCSTRFEGCLNSFIAADGAEKLKLMKSAQLELIVGFDSLPGSTVKAFNATVAVGEYPLSKLERGYIIRQVKLLTDAELPISKTNTKTFPAGSVVTFDDNGYVLNSEVVK